MARRLPLAAILAAAPGVLAGCAQPPEPLPAVLADPVITVEEEVTYCTMIGGVYGTATYMNKDSWDAFAHAKAAAIAEARRLGATHLVWVGTENAYHRTTLYGRAYRCEPHQLSPVPIVTPPR